MSRFLTGDFATGKEFLKKTSQLKKYSEYYDLIKSFGEECLKQLEIELALNCFKECIQIKDRDSEVFSSIGQCYLAKKDYQNAKSYFLKSLEISKENPTLF